MRTITTILATLSLFHLVACVADAPHDATPTDGTGDAEPTEMVPVSTFQTRTGTTVELYALKGGYSAAERGDASLARAIGAADVATKTPSELYTDATGTDAVPPEVVALTTHVGPMGGADAGREILPTTPVHADNGCSSSTFVANGHCPSGDFDWCLLNWWNGAYAHIGDTWYSRAYLCVKSGTVLWKIQNGEGGYHLWTVSTGELFNYYLYDGLDSTWLYYDVTNASGDQFQFGGMAWIP
jgi:hypothetical protein